jgi:DNA-binding beta-propeller fold protein YncE
VLATLLALPRASVVAGGVPGPTALAGSGADVWIADTSGRVRRLDARTRRPIAVADVAGYPEAIAADARSVFVATIQPGSIVRLSRATNRRVGAPIDVGNSQPLRLAIGGHTLWVADEGDDRVWRVDAPTGRIEGSTVVSPDEWEQVTLAADAAGAWVAFSASSSASTLVRLDVRGRIRVRRRVPRLQISALALDGGTLVAIGGTAGRLLRLDARTGVPTARAVGVGRDPIALALGSGTVWVSSLDQPRALRELDLRTGRVLVGPVRAPGRAGRADDLALAGGVLWVTNAYGIVSRIDLRTGEPRGRPLRVP